jgi:hypothetical protein
MGGPASTSRLADSIRVEEVTMQLVYRCKQACARGLWLALCGLCVVAVGCGGGGGGGLPGNGGGGGLSGAGIQGRVVERNSVQPIENATVTVDNRSTRSAADGTFSLSVDVGSQARTISISVAATNFHTGTFSAVVEPGLPSDVGDLGIANIDSGPPPPPF